MFIYHIIDKRLITGFYKEPKLFNSQTQTNFTMSKDVKMPFLKRRNKGAQCIYESYLSHMLDVIKNWRKGNY